ncbi:putative phytanoyl-CoA dioxygenase [Chloropicon primus]|uniref:Putative phytanoyl-CoA dioxygenase n=1 Tax=Chloropicon primus TaxID=1764295 RepID=A0A5B8MDP8_9CHLO|nr:putative phytanoyl-CoA dioxygenase [Chloropicon primus]UPQ96972.1 putative phytanoyl-CoA dioxygenase [Chloropicon primus]|eukprot:QDZ17755.1 putative phytanoyl-CoA dioxygenase [Chloropicon primus]
MESKSKRLEDREYWQDLAEGLKISPDGERRFTEEELSLDSVDETDVQIARERIIDEGYCQLAPGKLCPLNDESFGRIRKGIETLKEHGWPASFIFLYDDAWVLAARMATLMRSVGENEISYDMLAWNVNQEAGEGGFSPHRDRQPDDASATFRECGMAMYTTCWVPLTRASPDNSCLHVIPRQHDPGYVKGDDEGGKDPLAVALPNKEAYQHIRALPTDPGGALLFTHRIIHWGSQGRRATAKEAERGTPESPRLSISIGFSDPAYEKPYLRGQEKLQAGSKLPGFRVRLALVCAQMISYFERFPTEKQLFYSFYKVFSGDSALFDEDYFVNTKKEFARAVQEHEDAAAGQSDQADDAESDEDDMLDEALEIMLEREAHGEIDFEDDFDGMAESEEGGSSKKPKLR